MRLQYIIYIDRINKEGTYFLPKRYTVMYNHTDNTERKAAVIQKVSYPNLYVSTFARKFHVLELCNHVTCVSDVQWK